jgi:hypothetical protein
VTGGVSVLSVLASGCSGVDGVRGEQEDVGEIQQTVIQDPLLEDGLRTDHGAQVAITGGGGYVFTTWTVTDIATTTIQIAGRSFHGDGGVRGADPTNVKLEKYSDSPRMKRNPATAFNLNGGAPQLVVWEDEWNLTDNDIWGATVTDDGRLATGPFEINFDGANEKNPAVTYVKSEDKWLVVYTRTLNGVTSLTANWVSERFGVEQPPFDLVASGVSTSAAKPTATFVHQHGTILYTYNNNKFGFATPGSTLSTIETISGATGIAGAENSNDGTAAIAYRTGSGTGARIKVRTFSNDCRILLCANAEKTVISSGAASMTDLDYPIISENGTGFGIFAGVRPNSLKRIAGRTVSATGVPIGNVVNNVVPLCSGSLQSPNTLGVPGNMAVAAFSESGPSRQFLLFDPLCNTDPNKAKERVMSFAQDLSSTTFKAAN